MVLMGPVGPAVRLSGLRYNLLCLRLADQMLFRERFSRVRDGRDVLAMIFPRSARSWPTTGHEMFDAAAVRVDSDACRSGWPQIQRVRDPIRVFVGFTGEGKRRVKGTRTDDVSPNAQPIRSQSVVAN